MNNEELLRVLQELAGTRPVFYSEKDFQHELAWIIHQKDYSIRLELPVRHAGGKTEHLDVLASATTDRAIGMELKYKTKKETILAGGETFELAGHAATPLGRYDFWKDVSRLERFKQDGLIRRGFAIFLTNDSAYLHKASETTIGARFSTHDGNEVTGQLNWHHRPKEKSVGRERTEGIQLEGHYVVRWRDYSNPLERSKFKILVIEV